MKKKIYLLLFALLSGVFAMAQTVKVQGVPRSVKGGSVSMSATDNTCDVDFSKIERWIGEGDKQAALVIKWNDSREERLYVWGYRWTDEADGTGAAMLSNVAKGDPNFVALVYEGTSYGTTIGGVGYDFDGDGFSLTKDGEAVEPDADGLLRTTSYDFDSYASADEGDLWFSGWYNGYLSYWVCDTPGEAFGYSNVGASGRALVDGCVDGWSAVRDMSDMNMGNMVGELYYLPALTTVPAQVDYTKGTFIVNEDWYGHQNSTVNFLTDNGEWVLTTDDMFVEMSIAKSLAKAIVIRTTRMNDYAFDEIPDMLFRGKAKVIHEANARMRDEDFWNRHRTVRLTKSENSMDAFIEGLSKIKGFKYIIFGVKAFVENFVETGSAKHPSKVDIGPINTMITTNFIDGLRTRISAQTTANLNPHWFFSGYYARGWGSHNNYYKGEVTYSFNKKEYLPREFPKRTLTFTTTYDVCSPSDKFVHTDKDNVFTAWKWTDVDKMMFYNRQQIEFEREEEWGFRTIVSLKTEENEACGNMHFTPLSFADGGNMPYGYNKIRTTEARVELRFAPGETFVNTKQRRLPVNLDAPVFTLGHTVGIKGFLGGQYDYNFTEASVYKRFWLNSWGKLDVSLKGGVQWNKVPFPLLIMPAANLSYIVEDETFNLINNMEFLNDRYASLDVSWDLNGKIFNRIPLLKHLKWREWLGVKCLWGTLTDKNNPNLARNAGDPLLMQFPEGSYVMDPHRPYIELIAGIHNIFKIFHVQYVHRLNYNHLPTATKNGVRIMMRLTF